MSFLRPGARATLARWAEPALVGLLLALVAWKGAGWLWRGAWAGWPAMAAALLLGFWLRSALAAALARRGSEGPGVVVLREGEIGYWGPHEGGFVRLADLERVEIVGPSRGGPLWHLDAGREGRLIVPAEAEGADHLLEALSALPGFSDIGVAQALRSASPGRHLVWQRRPAPRLVRP